MEPLQLGVRIFGLTETRFESIDFGLACCFLGFQNTVIGKLLREIRYQSELSSGKHHSSASFLSRGSIRFIGTVSVGSGGGVLPGIAASHLVQ